MEPFQLDTDNGEFTRLMLRSWCELSGLTAGFTTRQAGNLALHIGDDPDHVISNRKRMIKGLDWPFETFTCAQQVHGNKVHLVTREHVGNGREDPSKAIANTDAMITNDPEVLLVMFFADCVPLYFYDPLTKCIGLAHAGWKGTISEIAIRTVEKMKEAYGVQPENVIAAIGPSIGGCCYEVDEAVLQHVRPITKGLESIRPLQSTNRALLDLKHLNRELMIKAGILPSNIEMSSWCTACRTDLLFSHRKENGITGRMMSWLGRK